MKSNRGPIQYSCCMTVVPSPSGGFGARSLKLITGIGYARYINCTYFHQHWTHISHFKNGSLWAPILENFLHISFFEKQYNFTIFNNKNICLSSQTIKSHYLPRFPINDSFLLDIQKKYLSGGQKNSNDFIQSRNSKATIIVVHFRRGDILKFSKDLLLSIDEVKTGITKAFEKIHTNNMNIHVHLHSEGKSNESVFVLLEQFVKSYGASFFLHLNEDIRLVFHDMVMADYFVISCSKFSGSASLLSQGIVITSHVKKEKCSQNFIFIKHLE